MIPDHSKKYTCYDEKCPDVRCKDLQKREGTKKTWRLGEELLKHTITCNWRMDHPEDRYGTIPHPCDCEKKAS